MLVDVTVGPVTSTDVSITEVTTSVVSNVEPGMVEVILVVFAGNVMVTVSVEAGRSMVVSTVGPETVI